MPARVETDPRVLELRRLSKRRQRAAKRAKLGLPPIVSKVDRVEVERREGVQYSRPVCRVAMVRR